MRLDCIIHIALDNSLVKVIVRPVSQVIAGEILSDGAQLATVDRIRHITDPVKLGKRLSTHDRPPR